MSSSILNVAGYKFARLDELPALKSRLEAEGLRLELRGTLLLAPEGVNLFLAGPETAVREFLVFFRSDERFADFAVKESWSELPPFRKLRVRLKKEIITMRHPMIQPEAGRAPAVDAVTLRRWLDQGHDDAGRAVTLLDTRNDYEIAQGTFRDAIAPTMRSFSEFPAVVSNLPADLREKTVVTFCTGGIRCEKAALFMREQGFGNVVQLDGGILKYFEEVGGDHYEGVCFVFDNRAGLRPDLSAELPGDTIHEGPYQSQAVAGAE